MQKTYWWRTLVLVFGVVIFSYSYAASYGGEIGLCKIINGAEQCIINHNLYTDPLGFLSTSIIIISFFLFFISDKIFLKWLRFALIWIFFSFIAVVATPDRHSFMSLDPTKELVSIWLGSLFAIISLGIFVWGWLKKS